MFAFVAYTHVMAQANNQNQDIKAPASRFDAQAVYTPQKYATIQPERADGRFLSSYAIVHELLKDTPSTCAYRSGMSRSEFKKWQNNVRKAMIRCMKFPKIKNQPEPRRVCSEQRDGYTLEKWEFYPFPKSVSTFLVLIPDQITEPRPAVLCIPGSGRTKEGLAGEAGVSDLFTEEVSPKVSMALNMVREGYVAVAVDNAGAGEASDLECFERGTRYDYDAVARFLLELDWHWMGYTSYLDMQVLKWMKTQKYIRKDRIVVSGFSLGTEPMMVLGVLDRDIYAFVWNDFLCRNKERAEVMTRPDVHGKRPYPNSIRHLVPGGWTYFSFPDIVASLAPRPIIFTEGGLDRDFDLVRDAYRQIGKPENVECHHYVMFQDPSKRQNLERVPEGVNRDEFFHTVNVNPPMHYFKYELIMPWLKTILQNETK